MVDIFHPLVGVNIYHAERFLGFVYAFVGQGDLFEFLINFVIGIFLQISGDGRECAVQIFRINRRHWDNKGRPRFVYENGVHFVNNSVIVFSLSYVVNDMLNVVPKIIKTVFIVCAVSNVGAVSLLSWTRPQKFVHDFERAKLISFFI